MLVTFLCVLLTMTQYLTISVSTAPFKGREEGRRYPTVERTFSLKEILAITTTQGGKGTYIHTVSDEDPIVTTQEFSFHKLKEMLLATENGRFVYCSGWYFFLPVGKNKLINYGNVISIKSDKQYVLLRGGKEFPFAPEELEQLAKQMTDIEKAALIIQSTQQTAAKKILDDFVAAFRQKEVQNQEEKEGCLGFALLAVVLFFLEQLLILILFIVLLCHLW